MSAELVDFRGKLTIETSCVLEAEHRVSGDDQSVILRAVMHEWATQKLRVATITDSLLRAEGLPGIGGGISGNNGEGGRK